MVAVMTVMGLRLSVVGQVTARRRDLMGLVTHDLIMIIVIIMLARIFIGETRCEG